MFPPIPVHDWKEALWAIVAVIATGLIMGFVIGAVAVVMR